jgi:hypothetical protein
MEDLQIFLHTDPYSMTARLTPSSPGDAHAAGAEPPSASYQNVSIPMIPEWRRNDRMILQVMESPSGDQSVEKP